MEVISMEELAQAVVDHPEAASPEATDSSNRGKGQQAKPARRGKKSPNACLNTIADAQQDLFKSLWKSSLLSGVLGVHGWYRIEPVIIASLITEGPLLLIGTHGTAKTYFFERLAKVLGLECRFYNASLLNYDDLVGVPVPTEDNRELMYIPTPSSIWQAQAVFFDEINRTRPELQNKIFPIVHERRVQGIELPLLRYRWAAMNPVTIDDGTVSESGYFGAMPLDHALADRFHFIVRVPDWSDMNDDIRRVLIQGGAEAEPTMPAEVLRRVLDRGRELYAKNHGVNANISEYLMNVISSFSVPDEKNQTPFKVSIRRILILKNNIRALMAALQAMAEEANLEVSSDLLGVTGLMALENSLPQLACGLDLDFAKLQVIHMHSWKETMEKHVMPIYNLRRISDPLERAKAALVLAQTEKHEEIDAALLYFLRKTPKGELPVATLALYMACRKRLSLSPRVLDAMGQILEFLFKPMVRFNDQSFKCAFRNASMYAHYEDTHSLFIIIHTILKKHNINDSNATNMAMNYRKYACEFNGVFMDTMPNNIQQKEIS